ncbi:MAG TPA: hypothetical protein VKQ10_05030 [Spirochaetota bacterium]|nr:hypothetical protein [Spirochaetota bacterium]
MYQTRERNKKTMMPVLKNKIFTIIVLLSAVSLCTSCVSTLSREDINTLTSKQFTVTKVAFKSSASSFIDLYGFDDKTFMRHMAMRIPAEKMASVLGEVYGIQVATDDTKEMNLQTLRYSYSDGMYSSPSSYFEIVTVVELLTPKGRKWIRFALPESWGQYYVPRCRRFNCKDSAHAIVYNELEKLDTFLGNEIGEE